MLRHLILFAVAALTLTGCGRSDVNQSANAAPANFGASDMPPAVPAGDKVDAAFITRTWGMGTCERTMTFHPDGTLTNNGDTDVARWTLTGATLNIIPAGEAPEPNPVARRGDELLMGDGPQLMTFVPCPAVGAAR